MRLRGLDLDAATTLFVEHVRLREPGMVLEAATRAESRRIAALLRGVPLDLEIAAASVPTLGLSGVRAELERVDHHPVAVPWVERRSRSALAPIRRTYDAVNADAQRLLRCAAFLRAPFSVPSIRAGCPELDPWTLGDLLHELVEVGLVEVATPPAGTAERRHDLPPLVAAFARSEAVRLQEHPALQARQVAHHVQAARRWAAELDGHRGVEALAALGAMLPDLVASADALIAAGDRRALRLVADLAPAAIHHGAPAQAVRLLRAALDPAGEPWAAPLVRGEALLWLAEAVLQSEGAEDATEMALRSWREGMAVVRAVGTEELVLRGLAIGARVSSATRDPDRAGHLATEGIELAVRHGLTRWRTQFEVWAGLASQHLGSPDHAWLLGCAALGRARRNDDLRGQVRAGLLLTPLAAERVEPLGGLPTPTELLTMARALHDPELVDQACGEVVREALARHRTAAAAGALSDWLARLGDRPISTRHQPLALVVRLCVELGDDASAAVLHGRLLASLPAVLAGMPPLEADRYRAAVAAVESRLGRIDFASHCHTGAMSSWREALELAAERCAAAATRATGIPSQATPNTTALPGPADPAGPAGSPAAADRLSPRELEVLELIGKGLTNPEIARALGISGKTVMHHTTAIYRRLRVRGRAEAIAWYLRKG